MIAKRHQAGDKKAAPVQLLVEGLVADARHAVRRLRRTPLASATSLVTLGLGIGASTALFSVVDAVMWRPPPFHDPSSLIVVRQEAVSAPDGYSRLPGVLYDVLYRHTGLEDIGFSNGRRLTLRTDTAEAVTGAEVTCGFLQTLGIAPIVGRTFLESDCVPGSRAITISAALWERRYGGAVSIVGQTIAFDDGPREVVGVLPPRSVLPVSTELRHVDFVIPAASTRTQQVASGAPAPMARLKRGVSLEDAQRELHALAEQVVGTDINVPRDSRVRMLSLQEDLFRASHRPLLLLLAAPIALVLLAVINLAHIIVMRQRSGVYQLAVRAACGAGRLRLVQPLLCEIGVLTAGGAIGGLVVSWWLRGLLVARLPTALASEVPDGIDLRTVYFIVALSLLALFSAAVLPMRNAFRTDVRSLLVQASGGNTGRGRVGPTDLLIAAQVALGIVLLSSTTLVLRTVTALTSGQAGLTTSNIVLVNVELPRLNYHPERAKQFSRSLVDTAIRNGARVAAVTNSPPLSGEPPWAWLQGASSARTGEGAIVPVVAGYFETFGLRLAQGRLLTRDDEDREELVGVINESAARRLFPGASALGRSYQTPWWPRPHRIVGVVSTERVHVGRGAVPTMFVPYPFDVVRPRVLAMRMGEDARSAAVVREVVAEARKQEPWAVIGTPYTYASVLERNTAGPRLIGQVLSAFSILALLVVALGVAVAVGNAIVRRLDEFAIKMALGAPVGALRVAATREMLTPVFGGIVVGMFAAQWVHQLLGNRLLAMPGQDLLTNGVAVVFIAMTASVAAYWPTRQALTQLPARLLRIAGHR